MTKIEGARKAPSKLCNHWMDRTAISWRVLQFWLLFLSHILWQHKKRDGLQLQILSMPIQLSGELLEQFKALLPVLPAHRNPCARCSVLRDNQAGLEHVLERHGMNSSRQIPAEYPIQCSFILHRHTASEKHSRICR